MFEVHNALSSTKSAVGSTSFERGFGGLNVFHLPLLQPLPQPMPRCRLAVEYCGDKLLMMLIVGMHIFVAHFLLLRILADSTPPASASVPMVGKCPYTHDTLTRLSWLSVSFSLHVKYTVSTVSYRIVSEIGTEKRHRKAGTGFWRIWHAIWYRIFLIPVSSNQ